ncbi:MAG: hypothetical protein ACL93V_14025 [Candidatus Electrothrix sp. YB6]
MRDYKKVNENIEKLESMLPSILDFSKPDWKAIWQQIKVTGKSFKGVRFPSKNEHEAAWNRFQRSVDKVKAQQAKSQEEWEKKKEESARLGKQIISQAKAARPVDSAFSDFILTLATGGVYMLLDAIMGPFDEEKEQLKACNKALQKGWDMLREHKEHMLGKDKGLAFEALNETKELLDQRWERYKAERQKAYEKYQRERAGKRRAWEEKVEANIRNLEERRNKLNNVLAHKERHLDELHDKLGEARSDNFRSVVSG